jgi:hypothetical protein
VLYGAAHALKTGTWPPGPRPCSGWSSARTTTTAGRRIGRTPHVTVERGDLFRAVLTARQVLPPIT